MSGGNCGFFVLRNGSCVSVLAGHSQWSGPPLAPSRAAGESQLTAVLRALGWCAVAASAVWGLPDEAAGPRGALMASMMGQLQRGATAVTQIARDTTNGLFPTGGAADAYSERVPGTRCHSAITARPLSAATGVLGLVSTA